MTSSPHRPKRSPSPKKYGEEASDLMTALHEVIGHGSGKLNPKLQGGPEVHLKEYYSTLEEARADLMALWNIFDPKLQQLGLVSSPDVGKAMYYSAMRVAITQLQRIPKGDTIEEDHQRNRQLIVNYIMDKTGATEKVERNGKTYLVLKDFEKMREGVGKLLAELMRIKAEGDYAAIKALVDKYGVHFDPALRDQVIARYKALDVPTYWGGINADLTAKFDAAGKIQSVSISYPRDFVKAATGLRGHVRGTIAALWLPGFIRRLRAPPEIVDLRRLSARDLEPLLDEETASLAQRAGVGFREIRRPGAPLRRPARAERQRPDRKRRGRRLPLLRSGRQQGSDRRSVRSPRSAHGERETCLLEAALEAVMASPSITRIESQLMMLPWPSGGPMPHDECLGRFERNFMRIDLREADLAEGRVRRRHVHREMGGPISGRGLAIDLRRVHGPRRQPHQRPVPDDSGRAAVPVQHRAVSRLRRLLSPGILRGIRRRDRPLIGHIARQPGGARVRAHHPDLRGAGCPGDGSGPRAAASIARDASGNGLPFGEFDGDRCQ